MRTIIKYFLVVLLAIGQGFTTVLAQSISGGLTEEIVVTAQRREQNAQDIGVTVSVLDSQRIAAFSLQSLPDITETLANVELFEDYGGHGLPTWVIRGVGLQDFNSNNTPTAAVYVDDVYQVSNVMSAVNLFDTERVEVLKGPQGGLYGRNTSGGAVTLRTQRAVLDERSGYVSMGYGSWQNWELESAVNIPVGETAALRVAVNREFSRSSWQKSLVDGQTWGEADIWDARVWLHYQPGENSRLQWKLYTGENNSEITLGRAIGLYSPEGGYCNAVLSGFRDDNNCYTLAGVAAAAVGQTPVPPSVQAANGSTSLSQPFNTLDNRYIGSSLIFEHTVGSLQFTSVSNVENFDYGADVDFDGTPLEFGHNLGNSEIQVWSQEFRLSSPQEDRLSWLVGVTASKDDFSEDREFRLRDSIVANLMIGQLLYDQDTSSYAVYGDVNYRLNDDLSLHGTLRYTKEDKDYINGTVIGPLFPPPFDVVVSGLNSEYSLDSRVMGNVGINWQARDNFLVYASVSRGFKAGGFFGGFPLEPGDTEPYREETVWAYELGFKSDWRDAVMFNAAAFYYDYRDVQGYITRFSSITQTDIELLSNQGDAEHYGAELELVWAINDAFSVILNTGYLNAKITDSQVNTLNILRQPVLVSGRRPYAPRFSTFTALQYQTALGNNLQLTANLDYNWRDDFGGSMPSLPDRAVKQLDGYGLLNGSVFIVPPSGDWSLSLWVKNLTDENYVPRVVFDSFGDFIDIPGTPRSLGIKLQKSW